MAGDSQWMFLDPFGVSVGMGAHTPESQYPDGYLQPGYGRRSRRADPLPPPLNSKSYDRGVHKFTKLPPDRYFFPENFNVGSRLREPVSVGDTGLPEIRRQSATGTVAEIFEATIEAPPEWVDSTTRYLPPWS